MKILLVEDDRKLGQFICKGLQEVSYTPVWARSCAEARTELATHQPEVIILDIGLPDGSGLDLLSEWRERNLPIPVLILSARHEVDDRIAGLNLGADDYLSKPFSFGELLARLRSLTRRHAPQKKTAIDHKGIHMDLLTREVMVDGRTVELTAREFALLELFLVNPNRVLTRTQIAERIWNCHFDMETNLVDVYVGKLRSKLRRKEETEPMLQTVRGVGYRLV
jgi:DNA-binding response OmpR family regulator